MRNLISAISSRRSVRNSAPVPFASARNSMFTGGDGGLSVGEQALDAYGSVGTLFAIVSQIMTAVSSVDWHLYKRMSTRDKTRRTEIMGSALMTAWERPNDFMEGTFFRESCQQHFELVGETDIVLYKLGGHIAEMWPVRPDRLVPVKHPRDFLVGWIYKGPDGEEVPLAIDEVLQIKLPNPKDPYRGMGAVQAMLTDIDSAKYSAEWNRNFFINGAQPGGVITVDYRMGDDEFKDFTNRWRSQHQGVANAHRVAVLENAKWETTNYTMEDMQFAELRNLPRELIREAFAFPKPMLGTVDDVNRANSDAAKEIMAENITVPRCRRWRNTLNTFLVPQFAGGKAQEMDFDDPRTPDQVTVNATLVAQTTAYKTLRDAGVDPEDAALVAGLPVMSVATPPAHVSEAAPATTPDESDSPEQDDSSATGRRYAYA